MQSQSSRASRHNRNRAIQLKDAAKVIELNVCLGGHVGEKNSKSGDKKRLQGVAAHQASNTTVPGGSGGMQAVVRTIIDVLTASPNRRSEMMRSSISLGLGSVSFDVLR